MKQEIKEEYPSFNWKTFGLFMLALTPWIALVIGIIALVVLYA